MTSISELPKPRANAIFCPSGVPLLEAVLAGLWQEHNRNRWAVGIALGSFGISLVSLGVAGYATLVT